MGNPCRSWVGVCTGMGTGLHTAHPLPIPIQTRTRTQVFPRVPHCNTAHKPHSAACLLAGTPGMY